MCSKLVCFHRGQRSFSTKRCKGDIDTAVTNWPTPQEYDWCIEANQSSWVIVKENVGQMMIVKEIWYALLIFLMPVRVSVHLDGSIALGVSFSTILLQSSHSTLGHRIQVNSMHRSSSVLSLMEAKRRKKCSLHALIRFYCQ